MEPHFFNVENFGQTGNRHADLVASMEPHFFNVENRA